MAMSQQQLEEAAAEAVSVMYRLDRISHVSHNVTVEVTTNVLGSTDRAVPRDRRVTAAGAPEPEMVQVGRAAGERVCGALTA
ncbi:hypothetical protein PIB30_083486 [Stylosanthes scabra]|uniref:Uncharacterized protein n=1 Tax=Stylosanthes scabra TaxID=79078 RepID=A0ABU6TSY4_9FABA|nr:hypothetical protein [Stylosanthes scabra]